MTQHTSFFINKAKSRDEGLAESVVEIITGSDQWKPEGKYIHKSTFLVFRLKTKTFY